MNDGLEGDDPQETSDGVDAILAQWARIRPDLDARPMATIGRLSRAADAAAARLAATFAQNGLDSGSFDVLATLLRAGGDDFELSPRRLADETMVTTAAVAQRLNRLEARGLITRTKSTTDRRGTHVRLTDEGRMLVEQVLPHHLATERALLDGVAAADLLTAQRVLARIAANAREE